VSEFGDFVACVLAPVLARWDLPRLIPGVVPAEKLAHPGWVAEGFRPSILAFEPAYSFLSRRFHKRQPSFFGIPGSIPIELPKLALVRRSFVRRSFAK
jgi:hypothetical protein